MEDKMIYKFKDNLQPSKNIEFEYEYGYLKITSFYGEDKVRGEVRIFDTEDVEKMMEGLKDIKWSMTVNKKTISPKIAKTKTQKTKTQT